MKVSIVGVGHVGATLAHALVLLDLVDELVLVGSSPGSCEGDVLDLKHAHLFTRRNAVIRGGTAADTAGSDVVVLAASKPWKDGGGDRLALARRNAELFRQLVPPLAEASPEGVFLVLTNPCDVLVAVTLEASGFPWQRVLGTGTLLDSARFRDVLSDEVGIHPQDLQAYVVGEHGDSQVPLWGAAEAGGEPIEDTPARREAFERVRRMGPRVMELKGHTNFGVATAAASVIEAIGADGRRTMPLSVVTDGHAGVSGVPVSVPVVVGRGGVTKVLHPRLSKEEAEAFRASAEVVRQAIETTR